MIYSRFHHSYVNYSVAYMVYRIEAERRIYASVHQNIIDSDNGLAPIRRQVII